MTTTYKVELILRSRKWGRGMVIDIAKEFDTAEPYRGRDNTISVTYNLPLPSSISPNQRAFEEKEAYRLAANRALATFETMDWGEPAIVNADIERVESTSTPIQNRTIDDADHWEEAESDADYDYIHTSSNDTIRILSPNDGGRDGDWEVVRNYDHCLGRWDSEETAHKKAIKWMIANPYSFNPANSYISRGRH